MLAALTISLFALASSAHANVMYHYSGQAQTAVPTYSRDGGVITYMPPTALLTFDFTVATALGANLNATITSSILSWDASGGSAISTVRSTDSGAVLSSVAVTTDAAGNIIPSTGWHFFASGNTSAQPGNLGVSPGFVFDAGSEYVNFTSNLTSQPVGGIGCTGCGTQGVFSIVTAPTGIAEPSGMVFLMLGLAGFLGWRIRRASFMTAPAST